MKQNNNDDEELKDQIREPGKNEDEEKEDWRDEHGDPNFEYLESLAEDGSPDAREKLRSVADDLNVAYDESTSPDDLVGRIRSATEKNEDENSDLTV